MNASLLMETIMWGGGVNRLTHQDLFRISNQSRVFAGFADPDLAAVPYRIMGLLCFCLLTMWFGLDKTHLGILF